jgi:hypothetical protein
MAGVLSGCVSQSPNVLSEYVTEHILSGCESVSTCGIPLVTPGCMRLPFHVLYGIEWQELFYIICFNLWTHTHTHTHTHVFPGRRHPIKLEFQVNNK